MDASKRLNAMEEIFPKENGKFIFPVADGRITLSGRDRELRTSTLIRERPIRGESHIDFLGESEGSLPPPRDLFPEAGEAINDFWSMSGNFKNRHHVEPRVKLYSPREESFPVPLKYIDVSRTPHTNLDVMQERRIDDYWNVDGSRDLSDSWTGFTQFSLLEEKPPDGKMWFGERLTRKQLTSRPDHLWPELWTKLGRNAQLKEKQKWSNEKLHLENARKLRGIYFIDPEDKEVKETIKNARINWKRQWLPPCLARQARTVSMERPVVNPMRSNQNLRVFWKPVNPQDCVWENLYRIIMKTILQEKEIIHYNITIWHKFIPMPQAMKIPAAKAAVDKEWEKLEKISAWNLTKVRSKKDVIDEGRTKGIKVHFASLMDICHLKMPNWRQSTRNIKDELFSAVIL